MKEIFTNLFILFHLSNKSKAGRRYSSSRYSMYNSIEKRIRKLHLSGKVLLISERGEQSIRSMFPKGTDFISTRYPPIDILRLSSAFGRNRFDVIISDQVLEHVSDPMKAIEQIYKVLKPGGVAINTSCSFNPIHDSPDYFRFTPQGFREIHKIFDRIICVNSWGNPEMIRKFITNGRVSFDVRKNPRELFWSLKNDLKWPWVVWCFAQKKRL